MRQRELAGQVALVTGASGGIGEAIAHVLADAGARVVLQGRRRERLQVVAEAIQAAAREEPADHSGTPTAPVILPAELTTAEAPSQLVERVLQECGRLDILVNNAGVHQDNLLLRMKPQEWEAVLAVNLTAAFRLTQAALRPMLRKHHGRIIYISSVVGLMGNQGQANYAAAKAGLIGLARSLAREVATHGITVNVVAPGFIDAGMTQALPPEQRQALVNRIPMLREGEAEEVAAAVRYFAGPDSAYVTGQVLAVDGGLSMGH